MGVELVVEVDAPPLVAGKMGVELVVEDDAPPQVAG